MWNFRQDGPGEAQKVEIRQNLVNHTEHVVSPKSNGKLLKLVNK